jgi:hypothetical protein
MLDPLTQIPGCRLSNKIGNHTDHVPEPGKTIRIRLDSLACCEAVAELYAYIAYPDPLDANQREKFSIAMARWQSVSGGYWNRSGMNAQTGSRLFGRLFFLSQSSSFYKFINAGAKSFIEDW